MEVIIRPDADQAALLVARVVAARLRARPELVLGLATGRTMERVYRALVRMHAEQALDFAGCRSFTLDEYIGLGPDDPRSFHAYLARHLFDHVNLDRAKTHLLDGLAADHGTEAARYEAQISAAGGIDVQLLGIGVAGHIGFNEPLSALRSRTRAKALSPATLRQNAEAFGGDPAAVPKRALTMGVATILEARELVVLVTGAAKADVLARAVEGPITAMVSATAIQLHPACKVVVDEDAAARLEGQDYYRWIFDNEPEWAPFRG